MNKKHFALIGTLVALAAGGALLGVDRAAAQQQGVEELTRGPVHEAFATSVNYNPEPGIIIRTAPPAPIEEVPPDQQPVGTNIAWIPGYWGWDEEVNNFIWISGIWRNLPPGRQWVPGYWAELANASQWQWTSGYWADETAQDVAYLSKPPESLEKGPSADAPSNDSIWVSGSWIYREDRYAWRPGYWESAQENWTWVPAHYQWTPRGYVFVEGYWDYDVPRRGMVFAPVRFEREVYSRPDYYYTPSTVIAVNVFLNHLFIRPNYGHCYFGDYYAPRYRNEGYFASFAYHNDRRGYDPIYVHDRWEHRRDGNWDRRRRENFEFYRDNEDARPPRTWSALLARPDGDRRGRRDDFEFAQPLNRLVANRESSQRFQAVDRGQRDRILAQRQEMRDFSRGRQQAERERQGERSSDRPKDRVEAIREKFTRSPIVAKRIDQLTGNDAPPQRREGRGEGRGPDPRNPREGAGRPDREQPGRPTVPEVAGREGKDRENRDQRPGPSAPEGGRERPGLPPGAMNREDRDRDNNRPGRTEDEGGKRRPDVVPAPPSQPETRERDIQRPLPMPGRQDQKPGAERQAERPQPQPQPEREAQRPQPQPERQRPQPQPERQRPQPQPERQRPQPQPEREAQRPQPQPERQRPQPQPEREAQRPQPKPERQAQRPQPQPERQRPQPERQAQRPQPQPERQRPQPQSQPERQAQRPQPQPERQRAQPQPQRQQEARPQRQAPQAQPQRQAPQPEQKGGGKGKSRD